MEAHPVLRPLPLLIPVTYTGFSSTDEKLGIGFKIKRQYLTPLDVDAYLCGRQITGRLTVQDITEQGTDQQYIEDTRVRHEAKGVFAIKGYSATPAGYGFRAVFPSEEPYLLALPGNFPRQTGLISVELSQEIPED